MSSISGRDIQKRLRASGKKMPHGYQVVARKHRKVSGNTLRKNAAKRKRK